MNTLWIWIWFLVHRVEGDLDINNTWKVSLYVHCARYYHPQRLTHPTWQPLSASFAIIRLHILGHHDYIKNTSCSSFTFTHVRAQRIETCQIDVSLFGVIRCTSQPISWMMLNKRIVFANTPLPSSYGVIDLLSSWVEPRRMCVFYALYYRKFYGMANANPISLWMLWWRKSGLMDSLCPEQRIHSIIQLTSLFLVIT